MQHRLVSSSLAHGQEARFSPHGAAAGPTGHGCTARTREVPLLRVQTVRSLTARGPSAERLASATPLCLLRHLGSPGHGAGSETCNLEGGLARHRADSLLSPHLLLHRSQG